MCSHFPYPRLLVHTLLNNFTQLKMKTLFEEDLIDAGYELPSSGLCYNLDPDDAKALTSEGEWLLAEDELFLEATLLPPVL